MDLRAERTKQNIKDAFFKLRKTKPIEKITIREISEIAMINKATFYRHYQDIYYLSDEIENDILNQCMDTPDIFNIMDVSKHFFSNESLFSTIFSGNRMDVAIKKIHDRYMNVILQTHPELKDDLEKQVTLSAIIFGNFKAFSYYQKKDINTVLKGLYTLSNIL